MVVLTLLLACVTGPEGARIEAEEQVLDTMDQHWDEAEAMREAVVAGDLEKLHSLAASFEKRMPIRGLPQDLVHLASPLSEQVSIAGTAQDVQQAGLAVGRMAAACGTCHTAAKVTPNLATTLPKAKGEAPAEMVWHQVAEVKLWAAIVRHDDAEFQEAADQLARARFRVDDGSQPGADLQALEERIQTLARHAATQPGLTARGEALGGIIATCSECHAKVGLKP